MPAFAKFIGRRSDQHQADAKRPVTFEVGEILSIAAGTINAAKNVGTCNATALATHLVEKEKPLVVMIE